MTPPPKRRRLVRRPQEQELIEETHEPEHGFAHTVSQIDSVPVPSPLIEEVHIQIQDQSVADIQQQNIVARQASSNAGITSSLGVALSTDSTVSSIAASSTTSADSTSTISTPVSSVVPNTLNSLAASSSIITSSQPIDSNLSTSTLSPSSTLVPGITSTTSSTTLSSPVITSSLTFSLASASKNITVAENVLTTGLNGTSFGSGSRSATSISSIYSNSTYTFSLSSPPARSSSSSSAVDGGVLTSVLLTTATLSHDGQAASTITSRVGVGYSAAAPTSTDTVNASGGASATPPPPGTIAGGVVGGAAGLAVLLLVAMLFLRWYRRRSQNMQQALLSGDAYHDSDASSGPGMAERAGIRPWAAAIPALMRHESPGHSTSSVDGVHERGFQRIAGRKLPSAWSPGIEGPPPPVQDSNAYRGSGTSSFYPDSVTNINPFADSAEGTPPEDGPSLGKQLSNERMTVVQGPQRQPTIHNPTRSLTIGASQSRHMSSIARTSGTATTFLQSASTATDSSGHV